MVEADLEAPTEPGVLVAIEHATASFARAFPYLGWRYGDAGLHDARDDLAQLLAAASNHRDALNQQITWVAEQMTLRGQPRWMLEVEIELLARSAARCVPRQGERLATVLREGGYPLGRDRHTAMAEGKFRRAGVHFEAELGFGPGRAWRGFGQILCSAVLDERRGFDTILDRVREWALDPHRFGQPWLGAVESSIAHYRSL